VIKHDSTSACPVPLSPIAHDRTTSSFKQVGLRPDAQETFAWRDRAWSNREADINGLLYDPFILRYKDDPRFAAFCRKVGLPVPGEVRRQT
jgi:hypothetical protein